MGIPFIGREIPYYLLSISGAMVVAVQLFTKKEDKELEKFYPVVIPRVMSNTFIFGKFVFWVCFRH